MNTPFCLVWIARIYTERSEKFRDARTPKTTRRFQPARQRPSLVVRGYCADCCKNRFSCKTRAFTVELAELVEFAEDAEHAESDNRIE